MNLRNIILIGMPASGKSTFGVLLAKSMGYNFLDSDLVIQKEENKKLSEIIAEVGVEGFKTLEDRINSGIMVENTVIATGGSAVYGENAMKHFKEIGTIMYIKVDEKELLNRLGDLKKRGVAIKEGQTFHDLYLERTNLYEKYADVTVYENSPFPKKVLPKMLNALNIK
ncbi:MAG: shikimate kinase [Butyrivibrio sp.]|nr:shikimate kinase [Butyrivibrio sp.]